jgi:hypothetical protein
MAGGAEAIAGADGADDDNDNNARGGRRKKDSVSSQKSQAIDAIKTSLTNESMPIISRDPKCRGSTSADGYKKADYLTK